MSAPAASGLAEVLASLEEIPSSMLDDIVVDSFLSWVQGRGLELYPAQEEAFLAVAAGNNVILATPTGSGKSMVAIAAHFTALAHGKRSYYTAPIKALVSEKFFDLCAVFGADNVGMVTGDVSVNPTAPLVCATAEIVANIALRDGAAATVDQVVMDEFHYYADPQRGWAWQVPLLELPHTQFLLMSATLGDVAAFQEDLTARTGRETTLVTGTTRPVPLEFDYATTPINDTIAHLVSQQLSPVYVVNFTQAGATAQAQALSSVALASPDEIAAIKAEIGGFRFSTAFGRQLKSYLLRGVGVHHAGMLPKYRRLVERLAQAGVLKVISGTDTLGIGINVPIRTVLFSSLAKFDGTRQRIMKSREFHQIAGRAGRAGFDTQGTVVCQAPEWEIENLKAVAKAGNDPKKLKRVKKKSAPQGEVSYSRDTFAKLIDAPPETLVSRMRMTNAMLLNLIARPGNGWEHIKHLILSSHETTARKRALILTTIELYRGLVRSGIVVQTKQPDETGSFCHVTGDVQRDFALNQPLSPFAVAALELLDADAESYALDAISVIESTLDDPRQVLYGQERARKQEERANLQADGVEYSEMQALLDEISWPKPLEELLHQGLDTFAETNPWVREFDLSPKAVVRDMLERGMGFADLINAYGLSRSEGVVLRYLTDAWRALRTTVPEAKRTPELQEIMAWLEHTVKQVDNSLVAEWETLTDPAAVAAIAAGEPLPFGAADESFVVTSNTAAFRVMVRNALFRIIELMAFDKVNELEELTADLADRPDWDAVLGDYFEEYSDIGIGPSARGPQMVSITTGGRTWPVRHIVDDPEGNRDVQLVGVVDLDASDEAGRVVFAELSVTGLPGA